MTIEYVKTHLYEIRYELGLTCQEFADILGVTKQSISNWERGKCPMTDLTAYGIIYVIENLLPNNTEGDELKWKRRRLKLKKKY